jgi:hypothetical protein
VAAAIIFAAIGIGVVTAAAGAWSGFVMHPG